MIPEAIQVGPFRFKVVDDSAHMASIGAAGEMDVASGRIVIDTTDCADRTRIAVIHELLHACWWMVARPYKEIEQEPMCQIFAPILLDTLRRNPALVAYLTEAE